MCTRAWSGEHRRSRVGHGWKSGHRYTHLGMHCRRNLLLRCVDFQPFLSRFARRCILCRSLAGLTSLLPQLLHIGAEFLAETTPGKTVEVLIENCPERTPGSAVSLYFAENNCSAEYVADRVHPGLFITLEVRVNNGDVVIYFLQCQAVFRRGKDSLADDGSIRQVRLGMRIRAWWQFERQIIVLILSWLWTHRAGR